MVAWLARHLEVDGGGGEREEGFIVVQYIPTLPTYPYLVLPPYLNSTNATFALVTRGAFHFYCVYC